MTNLAERRSRIVRVRQMEHRVARAKLATAEAALANLDRISGRLSGLRASLKPDAERTTGLALKSMAEMALRLDTAQNDLAAPIRGAEHDRVRSIAERLAAKTREEGAEKLREQAMRSESYEQTRRADANRPFRKRPSPLGGVK
ncbi:MAG: hypothetical protein IPF48_09830 [Sphingomonadales bacterium]|jgi:hypothetical protein|nr:hypothetical protein [Sphingomonadales bacterium]MBK6492859.1 hypothetical protein [Sphingomonadales bacterium]MBK6720270.1 hypothetical protein [Sphingomonadales bacterium]MBK7283565.1 hypothetical protein [Sphingomonadales bacterium]MBP7135452.1 hypothetical protein [Sphingomonadaceae bacterium]